MRNRFAVPAALLVAWASLGALANAASTPYLGLWTARMSTAQMVNGGYDARLAGRFRLILRADGTYTTDTAPDRWSKGTYTVSGRRIVFANDVLCKGGGFDFKGVYTWVIANRTLRLTPMSRPGVSGDPCGGRWQTLTYPLWTRK